MIFAESLLYQLPIVKFIYLFIYLFYYFFFLITHEDSLFVSTQEQNTAVDGWNEQISQLTAECDQLKDSLQEINKVLASTVQFIFYCNSFQPANLKLQGKCVIVKTLKTLNIVL